VFETSRFLVIKYFYQNLIIALIDKKSNVSYLTLLESGPTLLGDNLIGGIYNDFDGGLLFQPENYFVENDREYMVGLINAYQIKALLKDNKFINLNPKYPERKKEFEKLANALTETDNQVLMLVRLKK